MKTIRAEKIKNTVAQLCAKANFDLRKDVFAALRRVYAAEKNKKARAILAAIIKNARAAKTEKLAICQDTGLPCVFVELGQDARILGDLKAAIQNGIKEGYKKARLRDSVVQDPLKRGKSSYVPGLIHIDVVKGNKLKITLLPKGFGCENKTRLKMFKPTTSLEAVRKFIIEAIKNAGPDACPPFVVGVGIGGTADYACLLAKKALLAPLNSTTAKLSRELSKEANRLNIGPMGLGGRATVLAVNILTYPTHIAGLPVAVNISCHATRSASAVL